MSRSKDFKNFESLIRSGRGSEVAVELKKIDPRTIEPSEKPIAAGLARRVGEYKFALNLLQDDFLLARENPLSNEPLIVEYAAVLTEIGAHAIAKKLFSSFTHPSYEMTPFLRALLWMKRWEYDRV